MDFWEFFSWRANLAIGFFVAAGVGLFGLYVAGTCFRRWAKKRTSILLYLSCSILFWSLAALIDPIIYTSAQFSETEFDIISFGSSISFGLSAIANLTLVMFIVHVFYEKKYSPVAYLLMIIEMSILPLGIIFYMVDIEILIVYILHLVASSVIYFTLLRVSINLRRKLISQKESDVAAINGILIIGIAAFILFLTLIWFVLHEVMAMLDDTSPLDLKRLSPFTVLGWLFAGLGAVLLYWGYTLPLRKQIPMNQRI